MRRTRLHWLWWQLLLFLGSTVRAEEGINANCAGRGGRKLSGTATITDVFDGTTVVRTVTNGAGTTFTCPTQTTTSMAPTPTPTDCLCKGSGKYCSKIWPARCGYEPDTIYDCGNGGNTPVQNETCLFNRCYQENVTAICMTDCMVKIHYGVWGGADDGSVRYMDVQNDFSTGMIYKSNGTGSVYGLAVNKFATEMKSVNYLRYRARPGGSWTAATDPYRTETMAYGARQDGMFMFASWLDTGTAYYHNDSTTAVSTAVKYTNLAGNAVAFCGSYVNCFQDLAFDGDDYLWVVDYQYNVFISTTPQTTTLGGPMKFIGKFPGPAGSAWGIAFDAFGHVYYGGMGGGEQYSWVMQANMTAPLNTTLVFQSPVGSIGDLASCAYPKVNISSVLAA